MINELFIFIVALIMVIRGATMATKHAGAIAESYRLSKYTVGFIIIAVISILPETFISITSAIEGLPSFGLGMLFGSNIADLTLVLAMIVLLTGRSLRIESKILKNHLVYPFILIIPLILGLNGQYSRIEGLVLIIAGVIFYYLSLKNDINNTVPINQNHNRLKSVVMLLVSMIILLLGAHFTVNSSTALASYMGINPILIGMLIVGLGTTIPEFFFSLKSVKKRDDSLAVGDILGTVLADATIVVGILALVSPFSFPVRIIYITGIFMVIASFILFHFMRSGRNLSRREAVLMVAFWLMFILIEFIANTR